MELFGLTMEFLHGLTKALPKASEKASQCKCITVLDIHQMEFAQIQSATISVWQVILSFGDFVPHHPAAVYKLLLIAPSFELTSFCPMFSHYYGRQNLRGCRFSL